jgi:hypothetical protein
MKDTHLGSPLRVKRCRFRTTQGGDSQSAGLIMESVSIVPLNCWYTVNEACLVLFLWLDSSSGYRPPLWSSSITLGPHSIGLRTSDRPVAETFTWQHTTLTRSAHPCPGGIRPRNLRKRAVVDPRLRPRSHRRRNILCLLMHNYIVKTRFWRHRFVMKSHTRIVE